MVCAPARCSAVGATLVLYRSEACLPPSRVSIPRRVARALGDRFAVVSPRASTVHEAKKEAETTIDHSERAELKLESISTSVVLGAGESSHMRRKPARGDDRHGPVVCRRRRSRRGGVFFPEPEHSRVEQCRSSSERSTRRAGLTRCCRCGRCSTVGHRRTLYTPYQPAPDDLRLRRLGRRRITDAVRPLRGLAEYTTRLLQRVLRGGLPVVRAEPMRNLTPSHKAGPAAVERLCRSFSNRSTFLYRASELQGVPCSTWH